MGDISLALAEALVQSALTATAEKFKRPVCVAVVDSAGFLVAFVRQDSTPLRSIAISQGKAYTAVRLGTRTQVLSERIKRGEVQLGDFCDDKFTSLPGGAPLKDAAGRLIGAVGVSGLAAAEDQEIVDALAEAVAKSSSSG